MKKIGIILLFILLAGIVFQQKSLAQDSSRLRVSLLTCTPGEELYSIFGHSAIRITDSLHNTDYVFNYGTFDFDDEAFYLKFIKGKLLYYVSIEYFNDFLYSYQLMGRGITEQVLNLSPDEKLSITKALFENAKEENRYYKYDFFLDNCTTRLRDIIAKSKNPQPQFPAVMPANTKFREAIHDYLDKGGQQWSKLGIDILLGLPTDKIMTVYEQEFLPDNLMAALDKNSNVKMVSLKENLYFPIKRKESGFEFTPIIFFSLLFLLISILSLSKSRQLTNALKIFDGILFFTTGTLGIILVLMWTATDHSMTKNNFNLLWALPTHILLSFGLKSKSGLVKKYLLFTISLSALLLLSWPFLPQSLNNALIPFVLIIVIRTLKRYFE